MNSSNIENRPPRSTTVSRQNVMSVPQYNQQYSMNSKLDHISEGNEDEESQFIGVVNNKYLQVSRFSMIVFLTLQVVYLLLLS